MSVRLASSLPYRRRPRTLRHPFALYAFRFAGRSVLGTEPGSVLQSEGAELSELKKYVAV